jgi:hypothetical protein
MEPSMPPTSTAFETYLTSHNLLEDHRVQRSGVEAGRDRIDLGLGPGPGEHSTRPRALLGAPTSSPSRKETVLTTLPPEYVPASTDSMSEFRRSRSLIGSVQCQRDRQLVGRFRVGMISVSGIGSCRIRSTGGCVGSQS